MKLQMKSDKLSVKTPFYYGWVIVSISALGVLFSGPGQTYSVSVFIDSFIQNLGWSRSLVLLGQSSMVIGPSILVHKWFEDKRGRPWGPFPLDLSMIILVVIWKSSG